MLQHDYLLELISQFVNVVLAALRRALQQHDQKSAEEAEEAIAGLLDLDPEFALDLAPDSLVTMMLLSGMADSVADYVGFTLEKLSDAYGGMGKTDLANLRHAQAEAIAESFGCDLEIPPAGFEDLAG